MANAFIHFVILACVWWESHYVAFRSTANQFEMDVFLTKAYSLKEAMSSTSRWVKQCYRMPWTQMLSDLWWDTEGYEICLYSNDFKGEKGITVIYRFMKDFTKWHWAKLTNYLLPDLNQWSDMYLNQDYRIIHPSFFLKHYPS
jgi:hypothetical protein